MGLSVDYLDRWPVSTYLASDLIVWSFRWVSLYHLWNHEKEKTLRVTISATDRGTVSFLSDGRSAELSIADSEKILAELPGVIKTAREARIGILNSQMSADQAELESLGS